MDIDSCITKYIEMAPKIFPVEGTFFGSRLGKLITAMQGKPRFKPAPLELAIKSLVSDNLRIGSADGENTAMRFESLPAQSCKVYGEFIITLTWSWYNSSFVCITSEKLGKHFRDRSYESSWDAMDDCSIWEACRATSAAPTFFPPISIGDPPDAYVDGGLGYNNPIRSLWDEVTHIGPRERLLALSVLEQVSPLL